MTQEERTPPAVVVGVDGSKTALAAALWAVDEAVSRDVPLRLVYAIDPNGKAAHPDESARRLASAEIAVRNAVTAIEATDKPVKIEVEISQGTAVSTLVRASRSAAMLCVGAVGLSHFQPGRVGSTAAALAAQARCPLAVIRHDARPVRRHGGWIVAVIDESPNTGVVLETAMAEARLRSAALRLVTCWQSRFTHVLDGEAVCEGNRRVRADLDRRLANWARRFPDVRLESEAIHGDIVDYLAKSTDSVQLVVVGAGDRRDVKELIGPAGNAALHHSDCSVLVVDHKHL